MIGFHQEVTLQEPENPKPSNEFPTVRLSRLKTIMNDTPLLTLSIGNKNSEKEEGR